MDNATILSMVSNICTLLGSLAGIFATSKLTIYRIEQLEKKMDKHNQVIERVYLLEKHNEVQDEKIKNLEREIENEN